MIDNESQEQFEQPVQEFDELGEGSQGRGRLGGSVAEAWRTQPIFKLLVLMIVVGTLIAALIGFLSPKPEIDPSKVASVPVLSEAPGGKSTPAFIEAQEQANEQRIREQAALGGSAIPTPLPTGIGEETRSRTDDPLVEFRAELEKQKEEQRKQIEALQQQNQQSQQAQQQQQQLVAQQDQQIQERVAQVMQNQMNQLLDLWKPKGMAVIKGEGKEDELKRTAGQQQFAGAGGVGAGGSASPFATLGGIVPGGGAGGTASQQKVPPLISAGTVAYSQLLTEANSDTPGPILAQILTGPLAGSRAIGKFQTESEYLIMTFNIATLKGKEYKIEALALDPDTTLGGIATEVDHRYVARLVLPAAAAFVSELGKSLGENPDTVTVSNGVVITEQARNGIKEGLYAGMGAAGEAVASFFRSEANNTRVLVRVEAGTPFGMFFTKAVCPGEYPCSVQTNPGGLEAELSTIAAQGGGTFQPPPPPPQYQQPLYPPLPAAGAGGYGGGYGYYPGGAYYPAASGGGSTYPGYPTYTPHR